MSRQPRPPPIAVCSCYHPPTCTNTHFQKGTTMKKLVLASLLTLGFALTLNLGNTQAATNCKDVLGSQRYSCSVNFEGSGLQTHCMQFDASNPAEGKFSLAFNAESFQCTCQAKGSLTSPQFNDDKLFTCGGDAYGDAFVGKAAGKKIKSGEYWCNGSCGQAAVFDCIVDPGC